MVNKNCQKCDKIIDTEQEVFIVLEGTMTAEEHKNNQPKKGKIICVECWEANKDGELINCCDVVEEIPLSQSDVKGSDGRPLKKTKIVRADWFYSPPKSKENETDNSKFFSSNETEPKKRNGSQSNDNKKLWVGLITGLLIGIVIFGGIIWWLLKTKEKRDSRRNRSSGLLNPPGPRRAEMSSAALRTPPS